MFAASLPRLAKSLIALPVLFGIGDEGYGYAKIELVRPGEAAQIAVTLGSTDVNFSHGASVLYRLRPGEQKLTKTQFLFGERLCSMQIRRDRITIAYVQLVAGSPKCRCQNRQSGTSAEQPTCI